MDGPQEDIEEMDDGFDFQLPIQHHSRPISRMSGDLAFNANLMTVNIDETDIDENLMAVARNLGIEIPEEPIERKADAPSPNVSAVTVSTTLDEPSFSQARNSGSTRPTSVESNEELNPETPRLTHIPIKSLIASEIPLPLSTTPSRSTSVAPSRAPSIAGSRAPSLAPSRTTSYSRAPSIAPSTVAESVTSTTKSVFSISNISKHSSVASSLTKSLRRLSGFSKKKNVEPTTSVSVPAPKAYTTNIGFHRGRSTSTPHLNQSTLQRPSTADGVPSSLMRSSSALSAPPMSQSPYQIPRKAVGSVLPNYSDTRGGRGAARRPLTPTIEEEDLEELRLAQERSLRNTHLQKLRSAQLEEQARFLQDHYSKQRKLTDESRTKWRKAQEVYEKRRDDTMVKHDAANAELEMRHLHAELELERTLSAQRRACETKLKYMEAYCNGRRDGNQSIYVDEKNYPTRRVTEDDYRKLVEQYHLRNGMATLHVSKINVLREQQAQQANKVTQRQDGELDGLSRRYDSESARLKTEANRAELELRREYQNKKARMVWRWKVKEAIDRRRLELERGQVFGELPDIQWSDEYKDSEDNIMAALSKGQRFSFLMT